MEYTYRLMVPNNRERVEKANGYEEELSDVTTFRLTREEYDFLYYPGRLFDALDKHCGTIIADFEEDRIESKDIAKAIELTLAFMAADEKNNCHATHVVLDALQYAQSRGVFCEIVNGYE